MKDLGDLHYFLGIEVIRTPDDILLSQRHYVLNMLAGVEDAELEAYLDKHPRIIPLFEIEIQNRLYH